MIQGEAIYKARARIMKYGVKAFIDMLGKTAIKKRGGRARLLKYYTTKYPTAPISLEPKAPYISRTQKSYWKDVKSLSETRDMPIKQTRKLLKRLKTSKNVQVRVIKSGEGWQLVMEGLYIRTKEDFRVLKPPYEEEEETGHSYMHENQDYDECRKECIEDALNSLGGSKFGDGYASAESADWELKKVLKETWIRYYGRETITSMIPRKALIEN